MDETARLAEYVSSVSFDSLPQDALNHAKRSIRDYVGLCLYGTQHSIGETVIQYVELFPDASHATILGHDTASALHAAFVNGVTGHAVDYDDTFESVVIHPSCTVFPAAFASAQLEEKAGEELLAGYVVGLDVLFRIGQSVAPSHWHRGWHSTATIGVFGAAAAVGAVLDLTQTEIAYAFGLAGSFSSGLKKNTGTMTNPIHCGHAAKMGVAAALLARAGATADREIFEGQYGYGEVMTPDGQYTPESITEPAVEWAVLDNGFKPYPSGVVTHSAMEALRTIVKREDLDPGDVKSINVTVDERVTDTIAQAQPQTALEAMMSYEFCLAAILRERDVGVQEFTDEYVRDERTHEQMRKVTVNPATTPFESSSTEASYGSRIEVITTDGEAFVEELKNAPGGPSNPLGENRLRRKFFECAEHMVSRERAKRIEATVMDLEREGALEELSDLTLPSE